MVDTFIAYKSYQCTQYTITDRKKSTLARLYHLFTGEKNDTAQLLPSELQKSKRELQDPSSLLIWLVLLSFSYLLPMDFLWHLDTKNGQKTIKMNLQYACHVNQFVEWNPQTQLLHFLVVTKNNFGLHCQSKPWW